MHIRLDDPADYPQVYALWCSTPGMGLNNLDDSEEGITRYLQRNPTTCFVAEEGGALIGTILSGHDGRRAFIYHLAVVARPTPVQGTGSGIGRGCPGSLARRGHP